MPMVTVNSAMPGHAGVLVHDVADVARRFGGTPAPADGFEDWAPCRPSCGIRGRRAARAGLHAALRRTAARANAGRGADRARRNLHRCARCDRSPATVATIRPAGLQRGNDVDACRQGLRRLRGIEAQGAAQVAEKRATSAAMMAGEGGVAAEWRAPCGRTTGRGLAGS